MRCSTRPGRRTRGKTSPLRRAHDPPAASEANAGDGTQEARTGRRHASATTERSVRLAQIGSICAPPTTLRPNQQPARNRRCARRELMKYHERYLPKWESLPFADPLHERQEPTLKRQVQQFPRWDAGRGSRTQRWRSSCSVGRISAQDLGSVCRRPQPPARSKPGSNACAASHAIPVAVLYCCTLGPAVRIMSLTCGAKGTRTNDPLLANNRQHVHRRPSPQVTVPQRVSAPARVRTFCGTSVLYSTEVRLPAGAQVGCLHGTAGVSWQVPARPGRGSRRPSRAGGADARSCHRPQVRGR
jgi:hypothetical protein